MITLTYYYLICYLNIQEPVIIENLGLVDSASKWDLDYLTANMGPEEKTILISETPKFTYFNERKCPSFPNFKPVSHEVSMKMEDFVSKFRTWKPGDNHLYFQKPLTSSAGPRIYQDFRDFRWEWLNEKKKRLNWGNLTNNLLLIGQPGNITTVHYDEQENLFAQVHGYKRVMLFHPKFFQCLYPYQVHHPCDRQSQVKKILIVVVYFPYRLA